MQYPVTAAQERLLEGLQRAAFRYFLENVNLDNGLVADTSRKNSPCSTACVGFALSVYLVAVERRWMKRSDAAGRTLAALRFFCRCEVSEAPDATGVNGFYYHFLDMRSGKRACQCEVSLIDTALLLAGMLSSAVFFNADTAEECEIRDRAEQLFRKADWLWAKDGRSTITQGWRPETGFLHHGWEGFNEALILFTLGLASPTSPLPADSYKNWTMTYQWEEIFGIEHLYAGPLFIHYFSHAWIDFRSIRDAFMREKDCDYFENTRRAVAVQQEYCRQNPHGYAAYGTNFWGLSAGDGPGGERLREDVRDRQIYGYTARGVPFGPDDGTICPWAMPAAIPFAAAAALAGTSNLLAHHPRAVLGRRFVTGYNPSVKAGGSAWRSKGLFGLDQGLMVLAIENFRTGLIWDLTRACPHIANGLQRAGFTGGWLDHPASPTRKGQDAPA